MAEPNDPRIIDAFERWASPRGTTLRKYAAVEQKRGEYTSPMTREMLRAYAQGRADQASELAEAIAQEPSDGMTWTARPKPQKGAAS